MTTPLVFVSVWHSSSFCVRVFDWRCNQMALYFSARCVYLTPHRTLCVSCLYVCVCVCEQWCWSSRCVYLTPDCTFCVSCRYVVLLCVRIPDVAQGRVAVPKRMNFQKSSRGGGRGVIFNQKNYIVKCGPLNRAFSAWKWYKGVFLGYVFNQLPCWTVVLHASLITRVKGQKG